ncbi:MAG: polyamine aminopropyltransferase [Methylococcaceae bacterium]
MPSTQQWFTEQHKNNGSSFSIEIKKKLHEETTNYQFIEIYATEYFGNLMVIDGCIMLTDLDNFIYHEMISHPAIFSHPNPKEVWIIGGGDCGTLKEVLKHSGIEKVIQIDIDERVTRLAEIYFPALCESNLDPRADLKFIDGILWVKQSNPSSVDLIIVDSTDPVGPAEGLFTADFFKDCCRCLRDDGLLIQQSESPLYHIDILQQMHGALRSGGFIDSRTISFPQCVYPSGWWSATMAGKKPLSTFREQDALNKKFPTHYYNVDMHKASALMPEFFRTAMNNIGKI